MGQVRRGSLGQIPTEKNGCGKPVGNTGEEQKTGVQALEYRAQPSSSVQEYHNLPCLSPHEDTMLQS